MRRFVFLVIIAWVGGRANAQDVTVETDRRLNHDFTQYDSFHWTSQVDMELDEGNYFLNDLVMKSYVRDAVRAEMLGLGYRQDPANADLLVSFRVFDKAVRLKRYDDYGDTYFGKGQYRMIDDAAAYHVEAGTLLISLIDRKEGAIVWQGFASGLINNDEFIKDEVSIHEAVNLIFQEFSPLLRDYTRRDK